MLSCAFAGADSVSERVQYNGAAPGAKIAFDDVGAGLSLSGIPWDLGDLFPHSYAAGARLHSDSWGSRDRYYDIMSMEIDQFTHDHDDYLVLVAAGNDGPMSFTVGAPATAKNILAVGASQDGTVVDVRIRISFQSGEPDMALIVWPADFGGSLSTMVPITERLAVAAPLDACSTVGSEVMGKIALIQRGSCTFDVKVLNAQNAGALAAIVFNNENGPGFVMGKGLVYRQVTIPAGMIDLQAGSALQAAMEADVLEITVPIPGGTKGSAHTTADFSSRGPTTELRLKPDVLCPGVNIHSAHGDNDIGSNNCGE